MLVSSATTRVTLSLLDNPAARRGRRGRAGRNHAAYLRQRVGDQFRHTMRPVHAKSHGLLRAKLHVSAELPEAYRQGLFAEPGSYDAILRLSTGRHPARQRLSAARLGDQDSRANRAEMPAGREGQRTQDFLCVNAPAFSAPNAGGFLKQIKQIPGLRQPQGLD